MLIASTLLIAASAAAAPNWSKPTLGAPFGINVHDELWNAPNPESQGVSDLGTQWVRVDFPWDMIEPSQGTYDFTVTDGVIAAADAMGVNVYATLGGTPQWATDGSAESGVPRDPADWDDFVYTVVSRYAGSVKYWGMWNEPNLSQFWSGSRTDYINTILTVGHDAAKRADPGCYVLGPELAHLKSADWSGWLNDVLVAAGDDIDVITQHDYNDANGVLNDLDGPQWPWDPPSIRDVITNAGYADRPFWLTETGCTSSGNNTEADQDAFYQGILPGMLSRPWWNKIFFYEIEDAPNTTDAWGVMRGDHSYKPAFSSYQAYIAQHTPVPAAPAQVSGVAGEPVTLDGSASSEPSGSALSFSWDFDESDGVGVDATGAVVSATYANPGSYTAVLTVTDSAGYSVFERIDVEISPAPTSTSSGSGSTGATSTSGSASGGSTAASSTSSSSSSGSTGTSSSASSTSSTSSSSTGGSSSSSASSSSSSNGGSSSSSSATATSTSSSSSSGSTGGSVHNTGGAVAHGGCSSAGAGDLFALIAAFFLLWLGQATSAPRAPAPARPTRK